jgi:glycine/D-amino acid oxidase-like deaminating enzyme
VGTRRVGIVGGGIVGVALAHRLVQLRPGVAVTVLEKEPELGLHQTGRNSGVVHAGLYYTPGSLKARLCRRGMGLLRDFCADHGLAYEECGKVVVALDDADLERLRGIHQRAVANQVPGVRLVGPEELRELEPHVRGVAALHSPRTAIVDFHAVTERLAADAARLGAGVPTAASWSARWSTRCPTPGIRSSASTSPAGWTAGCWWGRTRCWRWRGRATAGPTSASATCATPWCGRASCGWPRGTGAPACASWWGR